MYKSCSVLPPAAARHRSTPGLLQTLFCQIGLSCLASLVAVATAWAQAPSGPIPSSYFGLQIINPSTVPTVSFGSLGKQSASEWSQMEPSAPVGGGCPGTNNCTHTYNWSTMDQYVANANSHNAPVEFHMEYAPPWATGGVGCGGGGGSSTECTGPITDLVDMDAFLAAVVTRYDGSHGHGTVIYYEVSNEPFTGEQSYSGTKAQFATEHNRMRSDILAANPNAVVGCCGEGAPEDSFVPGGTMDQLWAAGLSKNWGFISIHLYPHHLDDGPEIVMGTCVPDNGGSNEHGLMGSTNCVQQGMARNGVSSSIPIHNTEGGWGDTTYTNCINNWGGGSSSVGCQNGSDTLKSAFVSRYLLEGWASGISRTSWYAWDEGSWGTLGTESKAAWQATYSWLVGSIMTSPCAVATGTVWTCGLFSSGGSQNLVVWNTAGSSSFSVPSGLTDYVNLAGNKTSTSAGSTITIGILPILLEGTGQTAPAAPTGLTAIVN